MKTSHTELQTVAFKAALTAANLKPEAVDSVVVGNVGAVSIANLRLLDLLHIFP